MPKIENIRLETIYLTNGVNNMKAKRPKWKIRKDEAWKVFSIWIRNRDKYCITCKEEGKMVPSEQAGHFYHNVLDFDEENVNGQCIRCNHFKSGNLAPYSNYLLKKLGKKKFEELNIRHFRDMKAQKHEEQYYKDIINKYSL